MNGFFSETPADALFAGTLTLHQPARGEGYRVNVDAVLLAWFAGAERRAKRAVDLGAGVGAVALSLLYRNRVDEVVLVEKDARLVEFAAKNLVANGWGSRGKVCCADVSALEPLLEPPSADLVVCNPPYVAPGRGRAPVVAKDARVGDLPKFVAAARSALGRRGRACFVYPSSELATLMETLRGVGLEPKRLRLVHASREQPARVALVEAVPGKHGGLVVQPPFIETKEGRPTAALVAVLAP